MPRFVLAPLNKGRERRGVDAKRLKGGPDWCQMGCDPRKGRAFHESRDPRKGRAFHESRQSLATKRSPQGTGLP
jgi:hypothetical protein